MSYSSYAYLLFFIEAVYLVYMLVPLKIRPFVLLAASYIFYLINSGALVIFLLVTTVVVYYCGIMLNKIESGFALAKPGLDRAQRKEFKEVIKWQKKAVVTVAIIIVFGLLVFLKYYNFLSGSLNSVTGLFGFTFPKLKLILPLGISYYTLMAASYIIDVYRGKYKADKNFAKVALFLCFFPQIVEGPIGRFDLLSDQLYEGHKASYKNFTFGAQLILWGLFKKLVIADRANAIVSTVFSEYQKYSGVTVLIATVMFTLQIYAEFSGCMDIVTGSAELFGIRLSKNFERPFFSKSVNEFWRRWHITLGTWLKDYVFYSVSLSKPFLNLSKWARAKLNSYLSALIPAALALFFVWFGNGFWHGSGAKYICYGLYYYLIMLTGMVCEPLFVKFFSKTKINRNSKPMGALKIFRTILFVNLGMLIFNAKSLSAAAYMIGSIFTKPNIQMVTSGKIFLLGTDMHDFLIIFLASFLVLAVSILQESGHSIRAEIAEMNIALRWSIYLLLILSIIIFGAYGAGYGQVAFIYGQF